MARKYRLDDETRPDKIGWLHVDSRQVRGIVHQKRERIASAMGISPETLRLRIAFPDDWRIGELNALAEITGTPITELVRVNWER